MGPDPNISDPVTRLPSVVNLFNWEFRLRIFRVLGVTSPILIESAGQNVFESYT